MQGYEVITSDDRKAGHVAEVQGDNLIIEHGLVLKKRHAVPKVLAYTDKSEQVVRLSVSIELVDASPKVDEDVDNRAVAEHYGLASGETAPLTGRKPAFESAATIASRSVRSSSHSR